MMFSPGGAVMVIEYCFGGDGVGDSFSHVVDMNQLASVEGACRSVTQWKTILKEMHYQEILSKESNTYFGEIILAHK